ncbi:hypothetical protein BDD12DRAFT_886169 [Trichophaea hybrida]|nr:hypothetical protein BDD12DRAFT_886169 [Trichophaea hybrida]
MATRNDQGLHAFFASFDDLWCEPSSDKWFEQLADEKSQQLQTTALCSPAAPIIAGIGAQFQGERFTSTTNEDLMPEFVSDWQHCAVAPEIPQSMMTQPSYTAEHPNGESVGWTDYSEPIMFMEPEEGERLSPPATEKFLAVDSQQYHWDLRQMASHVETPDCTFEPDSIFAHSPSQPHTMETSVITTEGQKYHLGSSYSSSKSCQFMYPSPVSQPSVVVRPASDSPYICRIAGCNKAHRLLADLNTHRKRAHSMGHFAKWEYAQETEQLEYSNSQGVIARPDWVEVDGRYECRVSGCDKSYCRIQVLNEHRIKEHSLERIKLREWKKDTRALKDPCNKGKAIPRTLAPPERKFCCTILGCGHAYVTMGHLNDHRRDVHSLPRMSKRQWCIESGAAENGADVGCKERPYKCEIEGCGKVYRTLKTLNIHREKVHSLERLEYFLLDRPFECSVACCNEAYVALSSLNEHRRSVHSLGPVRA